MSSPTLATASQLVTALPPSEQLPLFDYLADTLVPASAVRQPIQVAGSLGTPLDLTNGDPIADTLADLRGERAARFEAEWER